MVNTVNPQETFYDPSAPFRKLAVEGKLSNGPDTLDDPKSNDRTTLQQAL